jgi:predicted N-acyltransferase
LAEFDFKVFHDIDSVPILCSHEGTNPFTNARWLRTFEYLCRRNRVDYSYLVAFSGEGLPSAVLPMYVTDSESGFDTVDSVLFGRFEGAAHRVGISALPSYKVGVPYSPSDTLLQVGNGDGLAGPIMDEAARIAFEEGGSLYLSRTPRGGVIERSLKGSVAITCPPPTYLRIRWGSMDEYANWLGERGLMKGKKVRWEIRQPERRGTRIEVIDTLEGFREAADDFARLSTKIFNRLGSRPSPFDEGFFVTLRHNMGNRVKAYVARKDGEITAHIIVMKSPGSWAVQFGGNDQEKTHRSLAWINVVFYRPMGEAIGSGVRLMEYGTRSYDYKLRRGCEMMDVRGQLVVPGILKRRVYSSYSVLANFLLSRKYGLR